MTIRLGFLCVSPNKALAHQSEGFPKLTDFCPVYAQSEALGLIQSKVPPEQVIACYNAAIAKRISTCSYQPMSRKRFNPRMYYNAFKYFLAIFKAFGPA